MKVIAFILIYPMLFLFFETEVKSRNFFPTTVKFHRPLPISQIKEKNIFFENNGGVDPVFKVGLSEKNIAEALFNHFKSRLGLSSFEFKEYNAVITKNSAIIHFHQLYGGVPVEESTVSIYTKDNKLVSIKGKVYENLLITRSNSFEKRNVIDYFKSSLPSNKNPLLVSQTEKKTATIEETQIKKIVKVDSDGAYYSFVCRLYSGITPIEVLVYEKDGRLITGYIKNVHFTFDPNAPTFENVPANVYKYDPDDGSAVQANLQRIVISGAKPTDIAGANIIVRNDDETHPEFTPVVEGGSLVKYNNIEYNAPQMAMIMVYFYMDVARQHFKELGMEDEDNILFAFVHSTKVLNKEFKEGAAYLGVAPISPEEGIKYAFAFSQESDSVTNPALSADVILHEFSHYVVDTESFIKPVLSIPGKGDNIVNIEGLGLHEGFADYFAASLTEDPEIGEYYCSKKDQTSGKPKITKCFKGPSQAALRFLGGKDMKYSANLSSDVLADPHSIGEIWGQSLWELRTYIVNSINIGSKELAEKLIFSSLKLLGTATDSMKYGYEALLTSDKAEFKSKYRSLIIKILTERGFSLLNGIRANNYTPQAIAGENKSFDKNYGSSFELDGGASYDFDETKQQNSSSGLSFLWTLTEKPPESQVKVENPFERKISITPDKIGNYKFTLFVSDADYALSTITPTSSVTISVTNDGKKAEIPGDKSGTGVQGGSSTTLDILPNSNVPNNAPGQQPTNVDIGSGGCGFMKAVVYNNLTMFQYLFIALYLFLRSRIIKKIRGQ